jgi:hypothetical protein
MEETNSGRAIVKKKSFSKEEPSRLLLVNESFVSSSKWPVALWLRAWVGLLL